MTAAGSRVTDQRRRRGRARARFVGSARLNKAADVPGR
jgi:hypothetical protein